MRHDGWGQVDFEALALGARAKRRCEHLAWDPVFGCNTCRIVHTNALQPAPLTFSARRSQTGGHDP